MKTGISMCILRIHEHTSKCEAVDQRNQVIDVTVLLEGIGGLVDDLVQVCAVVDL